jgi:uncharacterized protein (TIGR02466 family)
MTEEKMDFLTLFETFIAQKVLPLNNDSMLELIKEHQKKEPSTSLSNSGGYQGHNFFNEDVYNLIRNTMPRRLDKKIKTFDLQCWVNINGEYCWNDIHNHAESDVLISGVYYVKVPENSGNLRIYDPRFFKGKSLFDQYYYRDRGNYITLTPTEGLIIYFPPWLHHMVEPNMSKEERVSIAFNILNPTFEESVE